VAARRTAALALALGLASATPAVAQSQDDDASPRGQWGMAAVFRRNHGAMEERYGLGYLWGFVAGYQITRPDEPFSLGLMWSTLFGRSRFWGTLSDDDPTTASGSLNYFEMSLGLRARYRVTDVPPLFLGVGGGGALMRTDQRVPPTNERQNHGGFVDGGAEIYLFGRLMVGLDVRYGLIGDAPKSTSFMLSASLGR
jgi:hypothetical protein